MPKPNSMNIAQQGVVTPSSSMRKAQASGNTVTARSTQHGGLSASSSTTSLKIPIEVNTRSSGNSLNNSGKFSASTGSQRTTPRKADQHRERNQSGDHEHQDWLHYSTHITIEPHDIEQQSLRSAVLDQNKKKLIEDLVHSQKVHAQHHGTPQYRKGAPGVDPNASFHTASSSANHVVVTDSSLEASHDDEFSIHESDDGVHSDKTAPALYMAQQTQSRERDRSLVTESPNIMQVIDLNLLKILSDEQLEMLTNYVTHEKESRRPRPATTPVQLPSGPSSAASSRPPSSTGHPIVQSSAASSQNSLSAVDQVAVDARKDMKRSKSAGGMPLSSLSHSRSSLLQAMVVDAEDPEIRSAFDQQSGESSSVLPSSPMPPATMVAHNARPHSRSSGVCHPGDKMFAGLSGSGVSPLHPPTTTSSPASGVLMRERERERLANPAQSPAKFLGSSLSPTTGTAPGSNPGSRPHSRASVGKPVPATTSTSSSTAVPRPGAVPPPIPPSVSASMPPSLQRPGEFRAIPPSGTSSNTPVVAPAPLLGLDDYFAQQVSRERERLDRSPFSAFEDLSVGSHSWCSSRSSNTRKGGLSVYDSVTGGAPGSVGGTNSVDIGSPTSTFSKRLSHSHRHHHGGGQRPSKTRGTAVGVEGDGGHSKRSKKT